MKTTSIFVAVIVVAISTAPTVSADILYNVTDLGSGRAFSVNNRGQIVGGDINGNGHAVRFDPNGSGNNTVLGSGGALSINDSNEIVGRDYSGHRVVLFDPTGRGNNIYLGPAGVEDCLIGRDVSINNSGKIVGCSIDDLGNTRATLFDPTGEGNNISLGALLPYRWRSWAHSINNNGQIVGESCTFQPSHEACFNHATLFDPTGEGNNIDLGTLGGGFWSSALSINDSGQIVGCSVDYYSVMHATLFDSTGGGNNIDLGADSFAYSINNNGMIVGFYMGFESAVLFDPSGNGNNIDLKDVIDPNLGWHLFAAYSINDVGWIVGWGENPVGSWRAFLLTPVSGEDVTLTLNVEPNDASVDCTIPTPGEHTYHGSTFTVIRASDCVKCPNAYRFDHWQGDVFSPASPSTMMLMNQSKTVTAVYVKSERKCGDKCHPIQQGDLNRDCYINFEDFAIYCAQWLSCTHPDCD